ncbi:MAG: TonB-dependent siderophore receptor [Verrucomicrobia bacterium]|nr:TonB-dependent siderophore receptor [Verrucomicrobiota bacterium]
MNSTQLHPTALKLAALATLLAPGVLLAQAAPAVTLDPVEVWASSQQPTQIAKPGALATRTETPPLTTPQTTATLNRTLLDEQQLNTLAAALVNVAGAVPTKSEEIVLDQPKIRGFSSEIYVDGLPAYGATAIIDPSTLINVQRIDVAKGPASALYAGGVGAPLGGLINLETKTPDYTAARRVVGLRAGEYAAYGAEIDVNQPLSADGRAAFRLTADYGSAESHLDAVESERHSVNPSLAIKLTPRTELVIKGQFTEVHQYEYSGLPAELFIPGNPAFVPGLDRERFPGALNSPDTTIENKLGTATVRHEFSEDWSATLRGRIYNSEFNEYSTFPFAAFFPTVGSTYTYLSGYLPTEVNETTVTFQVDGLVETGPLHHRIAAGLDHDRADYAATFGFTPVGTLDFSSNANTLSFIAPGAPGIVQNDTYVTTALWAQDQIQLPGRVHLLGGLRYTRIEIEEKTPVRENGYDEITPRIGAAWEFIPGISLFAARSEGFRAPWSVTLAPGDTLKPESSVHHETGFKFQHAPTGLHGTVSVYELERDNVTVSNPAVPFTSVQTGQQRSRGLETDLIWEPTPAFSLLTAYAYTDGEVTRDTTAANVGSDLPKIPLHSGRLAARYRFQSDALKGLGAGLGVTAASSRAIKIPASYRAEAYHAFDAQLSYAFGRYTVGLSCANLTDEDYLEAYQYLSADILMPARPRTFSVSVQAEF